jgi:putative membrane protein
MQPVTSKSDPELLSIELSARRTGMSFQRTRMSAERTLMSVIRTALSLIGFGFTIAQVFHRMQEAKLIAGSAAAPHNFGLALIVIGIAMLVVGIVYHVNFMLRLRTTRRQFVADGLIHGESEFPISFTLLVAVLLLLVGLLAIVSMTFHVWPFG